MYDQQLAGVMMKVITGFYLWVIIAAIFFKWSMGGRESQPKFRGKLVSQDDAVANTVDLDDSKSEGPPVRA